ncbi:DUF6492 family protein [Paenarthrobacter sp. UW852]|uniref:DUF6492 family protein n=1 Tax=Paenarthrobacter sp. UW852 TaxID=2951989 RepID=UPI002148894B|nr:DUF6492 family protein [Paenarthrobacter sp. UW852]MCR1160103.1 DUF6492 family protein [Paenarthrobacter sp. UW852]
MSISPGTGSVSGTLAVVTPSYEPDLELCKDLNLSVLAMTADPVVHHIVVPRNDLSAFSSLAGPRTEVHDAREYLPRSFLKLPRLNMWINAARPWPPVRGWICQQIIKLAVAATLDVRGVLLMDSDSILVRPTDLDAFSAEREVCLYRKPGGVDHTLSGHRQWHDSGRKLLGVRPSPDGNLTDYICWPCLWEPTIVRQMLVRIENTTGTSWTTAVASQLRFSEMMLYGIFVDEVMGGKRATTSTMKGTVHSAEVALSEGEIQELLRSGPRDGLAVMLSAKSGIPLETRRRVLKEFSEHAREMGRTAQP